MWDDRAFWHRLLVALLTATEQGRLEWEDTPEEPTLRAIFADGMIHLMLPEGGGWPPEVVAFDRWHVRVAVFRPEQAEDVALVERLYRLVERTCRRDDHISLEAKEGEWLELQPVLRSIEADLADKNGANGGVATKGRR